MSSFLDYFPQRIDYPRYGQCAEILPLGTLWSYVSSSLLNGFINGHSTPPLRAYVLGRYVEEDDRVFEDSDDDFPASGRLPCYREPAGSSIWVPVNPHLNKRQLFELLTQPRRLGHTQLGVFGDDVLILQSSCLPDDSTHYWYYWFDSDVSDCVIGRFATTDSLDTVISKFDGYVAELKENYFHPPWLVPSSFFSGWVSF